MRGGDCCWKEVACDAVACGAVGKLVHFLHPEGPQIPGGGTLFLKGHYRFPSSNSLNLE